MRWTAFRIIIGATAVSATIVAAAVALRWEGSNTDTTKHVPLRTQTADELAYLFRHPPRQTFVVGFSGPDVLVATRQFVVPGAPRRLSFATFDRFCSLYRVSRHELEVALGRPLRSTEIDPAFLEEYEVSFSPDLVPYYALFETTFLAAWLTVLAFAFRWLRGTLERLVVLALSSPVPMLLLNWYSPAFADADFFVQRIAFEYLAVFGLAVPFVLIGTDRACCLGADDRRARDPRLADANEDAAVPAAERGGRAAEAGLEVELRGAALAVGPLRPAQHRGARDEQQPARKHEGEEEEDYPKGDEQHDAWSKSRFRARRPTKGELPKMARRTTLCDAPL